MIIAGAHTLVAPLVAYDERLDERWVGSGSIMPHYDIRLRGLRAGNLVLNYSEPMKCVFVDNIRLDEQFRYQGNGVALYDAITNIKIDGVTSMRDAGVEFFSSPEHVSPPALAIWKRLVQQNRAIQRSSERYVYTGLTAT